MFICCKNDGWQYTFSYCRLCLKSNERRGSINCSFVSSLDVFFIFVGLELAAIQAYGFLVLSSSRIMGITQILRRHSVVVSPGLLQSFA